MRKLVVLLLAAILVIVPMQAVFAHSEDSSSVEVTLIHDTHFHGNFGKADKPENIVNYFSLVNQIRKDKPQSVFIGNGDDLASSVESSLFQGEHIIDVFNAAGVDVNTYGNHDFDMGPDQLSSLVTKSQFTWVSANLIDKRTGDVFAAEQGAKRFIIKDVNGVKLGITGLINEEAPFITNLGENAQVLNPSEAMQKIIPEMKTAGADIIVVSSHLASPDAEKVAEEVEGIDVIVGDHAGFVYDEPKVVNGTIVSIVGDEFKYLGELTLSVVDGKIEDFHFVKHNLEDEAASITIDAAVKEVADSYWAKLDFEFNKVIGETTVDLDVQKSTVRLGESSVGNYLADSLRSWAEADVSLINGGGIRSDQVYPAGPLTKGNIQSILPFTNYGVKLEVTGEQIKTALENGVSKIEERAGRFPQVSNISFVYDVSQPAGSRVTEVKVAGEPLNPSVSYTLATLDFIAGGGDGYEVFKDAKLLIDKNGGPLFSSLIIETLQKQGAISPALEGRIKAAEPKQEPYDTYQVKSGDNLWKIAKNQLGNPFRWKEIYELNKDILSNPTLIFPSQQLKLPN